jgi:acyl-CoA synthetase (AMP-forming)/AMP-acid ligase II
MLFSSYCTAREAQIDPLQDGWFETGDVGRIDEDGFLYLLERRQVPKYAGQALMFTGDIERWACECTGVDEVAAFAVRRSDGVIRAVVVVAPQTSPAERKTQVADRLSRELPMERVELEVLTLPRLPRTHSGKIDRRALRKWFNEDYGLS